MPTINYVERPRPTGPPQARVADSATKRGSQSLAMVKTLVGAEIWFNA
jgi:hypothetical protein